MILYTIVNENEIFYEPPVEYRCESGAGGAFYEGERTEVGLRLCRIISTNPADYLNPRNSPGSIRF